MRPLGLTLYEGRSKLRPYDPIVAIATGFRRASKNPKTGKLIQTYILARDTSPLDYAKQGAKSVCGNCPLAPQKRDGVMKLGPCYVNLIAVQDVWYAYQAGRYPALRSKHMQLWTGRVVRLGTYGDPAAVPIDIWQTVCEASANWVGYTHAWRTCSADYRHLLMASCETEDDVLAARALGYRTFRVRKKEEELLPGEFSCPASAEAGHRLTCIQCKACSGAKASPNAASPSIVVHGLDWKQRAYGRVLEKLPEKRNMGRRISLALAALTNGG